MPDCRCWGPSGERIEITQRWTRTQVGPVSRSGLFCTPELVYSRLMKRSSRIRALNVTGPHVGQGFSPADRRLKIVADPHCVGETSGSSVEKPVNTCDS